MKFHFDLASIHYKLAHSYTNSSMVLITGLYQNVRRIFALRNYSRIPMVEKLLGKIFMIYQNFSNCKGFLPQNLVVYKLFSYCYFDARRHNDWPEWQWVWTYWTYHHRGGAGMNDGSAGCKRISGTAGRSGHNYAWKENRKKSNRNLIPRHITVTYY